MLTQCIKVSHLYLLKYNCTWLTGNALKRRVCEAAWQHSCRTNNCHQENNAMCCKKYQNLEGLRSLIWINMMYYIIRIQCLWRAAIHSYESCSVAHEAKMEQVPGSKNTRIRRCSSALLFRIIGPRGRALVTLLLRLCVIRVEPTTSGLALC